MIKVINLLGARDAASRPPVLHGLGVSVRWVLRQWCGNRTVLNKQKGLEMRLTRLEPRCWGLISSCWWQSISKNVNSNNVKKGIKKTYFVVAVGADPSRHLPSLPPLHLQPYLAVFYL